MKLSVCVVAYNHERYIEQALRGALMQQTDFDFEIVVGEDCSTDRTREILLALQREHPERVRLLLRERNLGAQLNFIETWRACQGEYIAWLDGDDYWTSPAKLQRQVDFLEAHPQCAICFHKASVVYEDHPEANHLFPFEDPPEISRIELLLETNPIATCSVVFRNHLFEALPDWFFDLKIGDWPLHMLNARHGDIGYLRDVMAAYRIHSGGAWSAIPQYQLTRNSVEMLELVNAHFDFEYDTILRGTIARAYDHWAWLLIKNQVANAWRMVPRPDGNDRMRELDEIGRAVDPEVARTLLTAIATKAFELYDRGASFEDERRRLIEASQQAAGYARSLDAQLGASRAYVESLRETLAARDGALAKSHEYVESLRAALAARDEAAAKAREYVESLRSTLAAREAELADLKEYVASLRIALSDITRS